MKTLKNLLFASLIALSLGSCNLDNTGLDQHVGYSGYQSSKEINKTGKYRGYNVTIWTVQGKPHISVGRFGEPQITAKMENNDTLFNEIKFSEVPRGHILEYYANRDSLNKMYDYIINNGKIVQ